MKEVLADAPAPDPDPFVEVPVKFITVFSTVTLFSSYSTAAAAPPWWCLLQITPNPHSKPKRSPNNKRQHKHAKRGRSHFGFPFFFFFFYAVTLVSLTSLATTGATGATEPTGLLTATGCWTG